MALRVTSCGHSYSEANLQDLARALPGWVSAISRNLVGRRLNCHGGHVSLLREVVFPPRNNGSRCGGTVEMFGGSTIYAVLLPLFHAVYPSRQYHGPSQLNLHTCDLPSWWQTWPRASCVGLDRDLSSNLVKASLVITCLQDPLYCGGILAAPAHHLPTGHCTSSCDLRLDRLDRGVNLHLQDAPTSPDLALATLALGEGQPS